MSLHHLKVEVGGDDMSTDGSEPSHMHSRDDLSCARGYEFWLLEEAIKRNPKIETYALAWGVPHWIGNGNYFTADNINYHIEFLRCARARANVTIGHLGIWNERSWGGPDYVVSLRQALDAAGFAATRLVLADDGGSVGAIVAAAQANATFAAAFDTVGVHYPCDAPEPAVGALGKQFWASEDWWSAPDWAGAGCWGRRANMNYIVNNMTANIAWSLIWSVINPALPDENSGFMLAQEPWSGHYADSPVLWVGAHWTQFTAPGWQYLSVASGSSGPLPAGGSYVTLVPPTASGDFTVVLETLLGRCNHCGDEKISGAAQSVTFAVAGGLAGAGTPLYVWATNESAWFVQQPGTAVAADGTFDVAIAADAIVTVTTLATGHHGRPATPVPPSAPFPLPYADDFSSYAFDGMARFFSDQMGSFAVRGGALQQVAPANPGANAWVAMTDPVTVIGDATGPAGSWVNYTVAVTVSFSAAAPAPVNGTAYAYAVTPSRTDSDGGDDPTKVLARLAPCDPQSAAQAWAFNATAPDYLSNAVAGTTLCLNVWGCQTEVAYYDCVTSGGTCAGPNDYDNLRWRLDGQGRLVSLVDAQCAAVAPDGSVSMAQCGGGPSASNQTWAYDAASGALRLGGTGLCLTTPPPPPPPVAYAQVCGRIEAYNSFNAPAPPGGYCLALNSYGHWTLTAGAGAAAAQLAAGNVTGAGGSFDSRAPTRLQVAMAGTSIAASVNGTRVAAVTDATAAFGLAALGSGYHAAAFDDFAATAVQP